MIHRLIPGARTGLVVAALAYVVAGIQPAVATTFRADGDQRDVVQFISRAPLEKIVGRASNTKAEVKIADLSDIVDGAISVEFRVDLASVDTGIALRDTHMRDKYLETDKHPYAVFTVNDVLSAHVIEPDGSKRTVQGLTAGQETFINAAGTFELHGVTRSITVGDLSVTYVPSSTHTKAVRPGDLLRIAGSFSFKLGDYEIERPQFVLLRVAEDVSIELDVTLSTGAGMDSSAGGGCGGDACGGDACGGDPCGGNPCGGS